MSSKTKKIVSNIFYRLQYAILVSLSIVIYVNIPGIASVLVLIATGLYILFFELYLFVISRNAKNLANNIVSMLNMTSQKRLLDFPIPVMVTQADGEVLWQSENFIDQIGEENALSLKSVLDIDSEILKKRISNIVYNDKYFAVFSDCSFLNGKELFILYFINTTDHHHLIREYNFARPVVANILIDNYDEIFSNMKESEKAQAMAAIDDFLAKWAQGTKGLFRRIERDRYLFVFENKALLNIIEKRFDILDSIKKLTNAQTKTFPTLSIGVGILGQSFSGNEDFARMALDMALSRGGDQAVIKTATGYEFFGGRAKGMEKRSKVKARVVASALNEILKNKDTVFIMGHQFSDLDSLGSCIGFSRIARSMGKNTFIIIDRKTNLADILMNQLDISEDHQGLFISGEDAAPMITNSSLLVVTDTHRPGYVLYPELLEAFNDIVVIDHHRKSADFIADAAMFFHDPSASSACEMVTELIQYMAEGELLKIEAEALMSGIFLDTRNYTIKTSASTFDASSYLKKYGANTVNVKLLFQTDMNTYMNKASLVHNAEIYREVCAIATWRGSCGSELRLVASQAADDLLNIENIYASFALYEDAAGIVNISARSFGSVNVQILMERLNGGGHQTMAGAQIPDIGLDAATQKLKEVIDQYLNEINLKTIQ